VLVVWAIAMVDVARRVGGREMLHRFRALLLGFVVPALVALVYFAAYGLLYEVFWTYVVYPPKKRSLDVNDPERLETSIRYLARNFSWTLPLGAFALWRRAWRDRLVLALLIWLGVGAALVFAQLQFPYQFQLLIVPLGLLAAFGLDRLVTWWGTSPSRVAPLLVGVSLVLALIPARALAGKGLTFVRDDFALSAEGREHFHTKYNAYYPVARESVAFLHEPGSAPGPIHVIGDYVLQYQSGRDMAIAINGNTVEELDARLWRKAREQLADAQPPYIFVSDAADELMRDRSPETSEQIADDYCRRERVTDGTWYANRALNECS
jgi:hypothetical protein